MKLEHGVTPRGFARITFLDFYDTPCSLQKSSLATDDAIWLGLEKVEPQLLHGDAKALGIPTDATSGWVPYPIPDSVFIATRMHLSRDQVRELLPYLQHFADTGELPSAPLEKDTEAPAKSEAPPMTEHYRIGTVTTNSPLATPSETVEEVIVFDAVLNEKDQAQVRNLIRRARKAEERAKQLLKEKLDLNQRFRILKINHKGYVGLEARMRLAFEQIRCTSSDPQVVEIARKALHPEPPGDEYWRAGASTEEDTIDD